MLWKVLLSKALVLLESGVLVVSGSMFLRPRLLGDHAGCLRYVYGHKERKYVRWLGSKITMITFDLVRVVRCGRY